MVKISFQPAAAGIKADKADKAAASGPAWASAPAAEILLTPARVRSPGSQMGGGVGRGPSSRDLGIPQWPRRPAGPRSHERKRDEKSEKAAPSPSGKGSQVLSHSGSRKQNWSLSRNAHRVSSKCGAFWVRSSKIREGGGLMKVWEMLVKVCVWFQSRGRGWEASPRVGEGRRVERSFPQRGVMGPDWLGNLAGETLVSNKREVPLFWSLNGDCGGGGCCWNWQT